MATIPVGNTPGLYQIGSNVTINNNAQQLLTLLSNAGTVGFSLTNANTQVAATVLASGVSSGTYGDVTDIPVITVGTDGRVTNISTVAITTNTYSNTNVAAYLSGTVSIGNLTVTAGVYWANGQPYSSGSIYGNSNVAAYLPTYTGNLTAGNITTTGTETANKFVSTTGYFWANGTAYSSGSGGSGTYGNANVAAFLANNQNGITTIQGNSLTANFGSNLTLSGQGLSPNYYVVAEAPFYVAGGIYNVPSAFNASNVAIQYNSSQSFPGGYLTVANTATANSFNTTAGIFWANGVNYASTVAGTYGNTNVNAYLASGSIASIVGGSSFEVASLTGALSLVATTTAELASTAASGNVTLIQGPNIVLSGLNGSSGSVSSNVWIVGNTNITQGAYSTNGYFWSNGVAYSTPSTYSNANVASYLPVYNGNILANNVTISGNLTVDGNIVVVNYEEVIAGEIIANSTTAATSTSTGALQSFGGLGVQGNAFVNALYTNTHNFANGVSIFSSVASNANLNALSANVGGFYTYANATYSTQTALSNFEIYANLTYQFAANAYSNVNVASYLPTYSGNLAAVNTTGNITTTTNVNANQLHSIAGAYVGNVITANGVFWANGVAYSSGSGGSYGNTQVAAYLPTYTSNVGTTSANLALQGWAPFTGYNILSGHNGVILADVSNSSGNGVNFVTGGANFTYGYIPGTQSGLIDGSNLTTGLSLPTGSSAQRPTTPAAGTIRFNTDTANPEWFDANDNLWKLFSQSYTAPYSASYLIVAGGGGGGWNYAAGGGAGGLLAGTASLTPGTTYSVSVGAGGAGGTSGTNGGLQGGSSSAFGMTAIGGGGGEGAVIPGTGTTGGSGGGACGGDTGYAGTAGQGYAGGNGGSPGGGSPGGGGGGGGAGAVGGTGGNGSGGATLGGTGGIGYSSSITGSATYYAGGGGGGGGNGSTTNAGGSGGGGYGTNINGGSGQAGTANTGGGGGAGASFSGNGGSGGSGVVIVSVPTANYSGTYTGSVTVTTSGSNTILTFTSSGSYTA